MEPRPGRKCVLRSLTVRTFEETSIDIAVVESVRRHQAGGMGMQRIFHSVKATAGVVICTATCCGSGTAGAAHQASQIIASIRVGAGP